jgi:hypothetical protein
MKTEINFISRPNFAAVGKFPSLMKFGTSVAAGDACDRLATPTSPRAPQARRGSELGNPIAHERWLGAAQDAHAP